MTPDEETYVGCSVKVLPEEHWIPAAKTAARINPANAPATEMLALAAPDQVIAPQHLALMTSKYWGSGGVRLTVGFLDSPPADLQKRILEHMNAWGRWANVTFTPTAGAAQVRIARTGGDGYWSYVGTDVLHIAAGDATMNLDSFSMSTPDSEFYRVVRHETGHTLGFPHEHLRKQIVDRIDKAKAITYFQVNDGWDAAMTTAQVLTPIDESALIKTALTDVNSIMCYGLPGSIMKDGVAVPGGLDIDAQDAKFVAGVYPKSFSQNGMMFSPIAATAWGPNRLDLFGRGTDTGMWHRAWGGKAWSAGWESLGGKFHSSPAVASWGPNRLDVFGLGTNDAMYHKAWNGKGWSAAWENLGGRFTSPPAVVAWGSNRLDIFGLGTDLAMYHKAWGGKAWSPSPTAWENLGGTFSSPPAVVSWGANRLDVFGLGSDGAMYHKAWDGSAWSAGWESLGGRFHSPPAVVSWGPDRLDVFGLGTDDGVYHRAWNGSSWSKGWTALGGVFDSVPAVAAWGPDRLDVFGLGTDDAMYHKSFDGKAWSSGWGNLGGKFDSAPAAVSWGANRLDVFGLDDKDDAVTHKAWGGAAWKPAAKTWEKLGGRLISP